MLGKVQGVVCQTLNFNIIRYHWKKHKIKIFLSILKIEEVNSLPKKLKWNEFLIIGVSNKWKIEQIFFL